MVEIQILSGLTSVGGNFIKIKDGDRTIIFDQGIRFDLMSKYYSSIVAPRGIAEFRRIGIIPKQEWYKEAETVYISHMHLDHLGALSNIPQEITVKLPSKVIYDYMEEKWRSSVTWLSLIPRKYYVKLDELKAYQTDKNGVMPVPVSHSAYPAYAFIYFGKNENVLYTGDFRTESFLDQDIFNELNQGDDLLTFLENNKDTRIDSLIIEGTNIGSDRIPITPIEASNIIKRLAKNRNQLLATVHWLDIEYAYTLISIAEEIKMQVVVASAPLLKLLERISNLPLKPKALDEYIEYPTLFEKVSMEDTKEKTLILVSYREIIDLIRDLNLNESLAKDCLAIISESEPQIEEGTDYSVIANWFSMLGIESYRIRASGHYYQYQLKAILDKIKPKKSVRTIHTEKPKLFMILLRRIGGFNLE